MITIHSIAQPGRASCFAPFSASVALLFLMTANAAQAHFQELIPSAEVLTAETGPDLSLDLTFTHPMERGPVMAMGEPVRFGVIGPEGSVDLSRRLEPVERDGAAAYQAEYRVSGPGDHIFFIEPAPYWEPAEGAMIIHYTKTVVDAFGAEDGWDRMVGFPVEIEPLVRPYGLWAGNLFTGVVTRDGKPVPFATVEVEWRNDGSVEPPAAPFVTQVIKADANGTFSYAMPRAGWWGFAALLEAAETLPSPSGEQVPVELGALIWVRAREM
jgi:cobalt/nickel transport protein